MSEIMYKAEEMEGIITGMKANKSRITAIKENIPTSIGIIEQNWEGEDADTAKDDFKIITENVQKVENNMNQIIDLLTTTSSNYDGLHYSKN